MRSPMPIEPILSFLYDHLHQRQMACGRLWAIKSHKMARILVNLCIAYVFANLLLDISILWSIDSYQIKVSIH